MTNDKLDPNLTEQIRQYLDADPSARNVAEGAELLLRLNRNRILYANILRAPARMAEKVEYELTKHLRIRLDGYTLQEVVALGAKLVPAAAEVVANHEPNGGKPNAMYRGKRADHDQLPEEIRNIYTKGGELYCRIRDVYNTLLNMEDAPACDRYEYLKILGDLDQQYRVGWETYDQYVIPAEQPHPTDVQPAKDAPKRKKKGKG